MRTHATAASSDKPAKPAQRRRSQPRQENALRNTIRRTAATKGVKKEAEKPGSVISF